MKIVYIDFEPVGKVHKIKVEEDLAVNVGDFLVVETQRGQELARVIRLEDCAKKNDCPPQNQPQPQNPQPNAGSAVGGTCGEGCNSGAERACSACPCGGLDVVADNSERQSTTQEQVAGAKPCEKCKGCAKASACKAGGMCGKNNYFNVALREGFNVIRMATQNDLERVEKQRERGNNLVHKVQKTADKQGLGIKILSVNFTVDGQKMLIDFISDERVDFRRFVKDLASEFKLKIELRQIGSRDEVKKVGAIGPCGRICCCNNQLREFGKVAIKMAKNQNISLNPGKINGICGKLMCCLVYENDMYEELSATLPRIGSTVVTKFGEGVVMYNDILRQQCTIKLTGNDEYKVVALSEIDA